MTRNRKNKETKKEKSVARKGGVYIANLPHGFYERTIEQFFSQFGFIRRYKVARSDKNAKPMGYAFIEFEYESVAKVVAQTMNNYLMFNKIIKCHFLEESKLNNKMFSKSNLQPEFCKKTRQKRRNQYLMEKGKEEKDFQKKIKTKINRTTQYVAKALGVKKEKVSIDKDTEKKSSEGNGTRTTTTKNQANKSMTCSELPSTQIINQIDLTKPSVSEKVFTRSGKRKQDVILSGKEFQSPKRKKRDVQGLDETPIVMEIDELDEEIVVKTPPNVVKVIKKGTQKELCDANATTIEASRKKTLNPIASLAKKLFNDNPDELSSPLSTKKGKDNKKQTNKKSNKTLITSEKKKKLVAKIFLKRKNKRMSELR